LQASEFPSLHHRKEGWLRHQENFAKPPKQDAAGVVFVFVLNRKTTPAARSVDAARYFLTRAEFLRSSATRFRVLQHSLEGGEIFKSPSPQRRIDFERHLPDTDPLNSRGRSCH